MFYRSLITPFFALFISVTSATEVPIYDFPIKSYSQNVDDYLSPDSPDYTKPLVSSDYQAAQLKQFYNHYYSTDAQALSPWSEQMIQAVIPTVKKIEFEIIDGFDNQNKPDTKKHYAENFKEHDEVWLNQIRKNMDLAAFDALTFNPENRAIAVNNTYARALPEHAPDFYHFSLPGQGFPFDNLEESAIWAGTPLYVLSVSQDKAWSLVLTPDEYFAWVKSSDIAYASNKFVSQWQQAAQAGLVAITETDASIVNKNQHFQFTGYIGAVFPFASRDADFITILTPIKNEHQQAVLTTSLVKATSATLMPLTATPKNMAGIMKQLQNRPYGWGGMFFFNDCSQELKSIFTPFAIWIPRNSGQQAKVGTPINLSKNTVDERINALKEQGHPLMTIIYIGSHVMLYLGNKRINSQESIPMTYQNIWGMSPANKESRYIIGQSLFFPLLKQYPENFDLGSLANAPFFTLVQLDKLTDKKTSPQESMRHFTVPELPNMSL